MDKVSVIVTHWAMDRERSVTMRESIQSLIETAPQAEIIIVDNGGSLDDSMYLLSLAHRGDIACYIRNRNNMQLGIARNQALRICTGDYIVVADNDILFQRGWLEECRAFLATHPGRYLASPLRADPMNAVRSVRWCGEIDGWRLNYRAGSNTFMMRRADYEVIGEFPHHRVTGSIWCDRYVRLGYKMALMPEPKAIDLGLRKGFNFKLPLEHNEL